MPLPSLLPTLGFGGVIGTRAEAVERRGEGKSPELASPSLYTEGSVL